MNSMDRDSAETKYTLEIGVWLRILNKAFPEGHIKVPAVLADHISSFNIILSRLYSSAPENAGIETTLLALQLPMMNHVGLNLGLNTNYYTWRDVRTVDLIGYIGFSMNGHCHCQENTPGLPYNTCCALEEVPVLVDYLIMQYRADLILNAVGRGEFHSPSGTVFLTNIESPLFRDRRQMTNLEELFLLLRRGVIDPAHASWAVKLGHEAVHYHYHSCRN